MSAILVAISSEVMELSKPRIRISACLTGREMRTSSVPNNPSFIFLARASALAASLLSPRTRDLQYKCARYRVLGANPEDL